MMMDNGESRDRKRMIKQWGTFSGEIKKGQKRWFLEGYLGMAILLTLALFDYGLLVSTV